MAFRELVRAARSVRRFRQGERLPADVLRALVDCARLVPCGANRQVLRYRLVSAPDECAAVFPHLAWAAALRDWPGPAEGERPPAYIVVLGPGPATVDTGIAAQTIQLAAAEAGLGCCMLGAIEREAIKAVLAVPEALAVQLVVALGRPAETIVLEDAVPGEPLVYYRDAAGRHHVPKLRLDDVLVGRPCVVTQPALTPSRAL